MAQFNADINLQVQVDNALAGIRKVESALAKVQKLGTGIGGIGKTDVSQAVRSFNVLKGAVSGVGKTIKFVTSNFAALATTLAAVEVSSFANNFQRFQTPLTKASAAVAGLTNNVLELAAAQPLLTAQIAAGTVALAAFGPQLATATGRIIKLAGAAAAAKAPLQSLLNTYSQVSGAFDGSFASFDQQFKTDVIDAYRRKLFEISETVSELSKRQSSLKSNLDRFNSSSETAVKIAGKLVDVQARLNEELREQADLLRSARGVNVTELEASKGRQSIETRKNRESFIEQEETKRKQLLKQIESAEIAGTERVFNEKLRNLEDLYSAQLRLDKAANAAALDDFDRRLDNQLRSKQRQYQSPIGPGNVEGERVFRREQQLFGDVDRATADAVKALTDINSLGKKLDKQKSDTARRLEELEFNKKLANLEDSAKKELALNKRVNDKALKDFDARLKQQDAKRKQRSDLRENLALGAGFPLLFGAGPGGVGGGVLGALLGKDGGFGLQILFSAIGTQLDEAFARVQDIGNAVDQLDVGVLVNANVRINAELQSQLDLLVQIGQEEAARVALSEEVAETTGTLPGVTEDVAATVNLLQAEWNRVVNVVSSLLGIIGAPLVAALAAVLRLVSEVVGIFVGALSFLGKWVKRATEFGIELVAGKEGVEAIEEGLKNVTGELDEAIAKANNLRVALNAAVVESAQDLDLARSLTPGITAAERTDNVTIKERYDLAKLTNQELTEAGKIRQENKNIAEDELAALLNQNKAIFNNKAEVIKENAERKRTGIITRENTRLDKERAREADKAARAFKKAAKDAERARKTELRVQQTLAQLAVQKYDVAIQTIRATQGEFAANKEQLRNADALLIKRIQIVKLSDKDQRLKDVEIKLLKDKSVLERTTIRNKNQEIALQKELNKLKGRQEVEGVRTQLDQELAGLTIGESDSEALLREQSDRYANTLRDINNEIEEQNLLISETPTPNREVIDAATARLDVLQKTKSAYEELLPAIFAAEQQQLAFNTAVELLTPGISSLVSGFREVVAGTKSVEEALADFFNTLADQLAQLATQLIIVAIAKKAAGLFGGGATSGGAGLFNLGGGGSSVGSGGLPGIGNLGGLFDGSLPFFGSGTNILGRASGGPVSSNTPYIVGEKGRELFVPSSSGNIVPNDALGGSTVVNITINNEGNGSRSSSGSDAEEAARLGRLVERATLAVINREKRPGGTLRS